MENLKEDLLKALEGIAVQQNAFVTLLTKRAKREAEVFGSKH